MARRPINVAKRRLVKAISKRLLKAVYKAKPKRRRRF